MEEQIEDVQVPQNSRNLLPASIVVAVAVIIGALIIKGDPLSKSATTTISVQSAEAAMIDGGHILPLDAEKKMLEELTKDGVIDSAKLPQVSELNLLWAFGLANKNKVLESGPIVDMGYGGPANLASVGGWSVSEGSPMEHLNMHGLVTLTTDQQMLVEKVAKGIYRPCCNNSTHFPDCNHGMAMLGLLEYLASQGATEDQLWSAALTANLRWFPNQYQTIAQYLKIKGIDTKSITPQMLLGAEYSSGSGFAEIASQVPQTQRQRGGGGCGVDAEQPIDVSKQSGCGV